MATLSVMGIGIAIIADTASQSPHNEPHCVPGCNLSEHYLKSSHGVSVRVAHIASATAVKGVHPKALRVGVGIAFIATATAVGCVHPRAL